ncbi:MAG: FecR family protein [Dysgonomonas mossii]|nr:FecR family protein [Dysgonomonas mossii]
MENKIHAWLVNPENSEEKQKAMHRLWDSLDNQEDLSSKQEYEKITKKLGFNKKKRMSQRPYYWLRVAVVFLPLVLLIGIYNLTKDVQKDKQAVVVDVPYGKHEEVRLACGSQIWIKPGSKIKYNENLNDSARIINLEGQAYLSVTRQKDIPFIVRTKYLDVKVLGTQFNVSAYPDDQSTVVTLNKGSIAIRTIDNREFKLKPNQQFVLNNTTKEGIIRDLDINVVKDIADWTNGKIVFNNETLKAIALTLKREFDIDVEIDKDVDLNRSYTLMIEQSDNITEIIEIFRCLDNSLSYKIEKNTVYISNNKTE